MLWRRDRVLFLTMRRTRRFTIASLAVSIGLICSCGYFPEATFQLAADSRLPRWFVLPTGLTGEQLSVTINYYVGLSGGTATVMLLGPNGRVLQKVSGTLQGFQPIRLKVQPPGFPPGYPAYEIVTVKGVTEVVEHRGVEPTLHITDDPNVLAELGVKQ
jgi:hypothetical protein